MPNKNGSYNSTPSFILLKGELGCTSCCQTSNQTGKLNQIGCKITRDKKWGGRGEGEPQCATIYCCPPKLRRSGITFHYNPYLLLQVSNEVGYKELRSAPELPYLQPPAPKSYTRPVQVTDEELSRIKCATATTSVAKQT